MGEKGGKWGRRGREVGEKGEGSGGKGEGTGNGVPPCPPPHVCNKNNNIQGRSPNVVK